MVDRFPDSSFFNLRFKWLIAHNTRSHILYLSKLVELINQIGGSNETRTRYSTLTGLYDTHSP